jgi:epoxyqueuosine reductase QueG
MKQELQAAIEDRLRRFERSGVTTRWRAPLVRYAAADDPLFSTLREVVSSSHALPGELLPGARTVIAFFLPFARGVAVSNYGGRLASAGWARAYVETNRLIAEICETLRRDLGDRGHETHVTPATHNYDPVRLVSDWSHRHVAYIAGLGTLGLHNLLITESGACGRLGSCVTTAEIEPDARPQTEACLHKRGGSCQRCVQRCVGELLGADSFDRRRCQELLHENEREHRALGKADVCGKCLVKVPCSHGIPRMKASSD